MRNKLLLFLPLLLLTAWLIPTANWLVKHRTVGNTVSFDTVLTTQMFNQVILPTTLYCNPYFDSIGSFANIGGKLLYKTTRTSDWDTIIGSGGSGTYVAGFGLGLFGNIFFADSNLLYTKYRSDTSRINIYRAIGSGGGSGTVNSVSAGWGMSFTSITTSGNVIADSTVITSQTRFNNFWSTLGSNAFTSWSTAGGDLTGTYPNPTLKNTGTAGTYGDASHIPGVTTDAQGRVTGVTTYTFAPGGITSITTTSPILGGTITSTGNISIQQSTSTSDGYISHTDWNTFNNKGVGSVTSVGLFAPSVFSVSATPITTSGTLGLVFSGGQTQNLVLASPNGSSGSVSLRALVDGDISSSGNWNTAYTNRITSLTTTGSSGASALSSNTLNIPNYTLAGLGGVSTSRNINTTSPLTGGGALSSDLTVAVTYSTTPTASTIAAWDANKIMSAPNFIPGYTTTASAGTTVTLTVSSNYGQWTTGTTTEIYQMPVASTLTLGQMYYFANRSTQQVTINSSGGNLIQTMAAGTNAIMECIKNSATDATSWDASYSVNNYSALTLLGLIATYNGNTVYGNGVLSISGYQRATAQAGAKTLNGTGGVVTVGASDASYLVSSSIRVTASTTNSFQAICTYTDDGGNVISLPETFSQLGTLLNTITNVTGVGNYEGVSEHIRAKAGTTITWSTTGTFTSVTYNFEGQITCVSPN